MFTIFTVISWLIWVVAQHIQNSYTRPSRKCVSFFVRFLLGVVQPLFVYSREWFTLAVVFEAYTSQAFSPFSCWSPKMSPFGGLSNKDLVLFFTFPRTVYSRVSCCFLLRRYTFQAPFSFLVDPRKCLFSLGCLTRIWFLSLTFPRTVYSRVSWCFLLRRYTFQAFFSSLFGLRKLSPFDVYLTRNCYFPRFSEKCLLSCFVVVFSWGVTPFKLFFLSVWFPKAVSLSCIT